MTWALVYNEDFIKSYKGRWTGLIISAVDGTSLLFDGDYASKDKCQEDIDKLLLDPPEGPTGPELKWDCGLTLSLDKVLFVIPIPCISL